MPLVYQGLTLTGCQTCCASRYPGLEEAGEVRESVDDIRERMEETESELPCTKERALIIELLQTARQRWLSTRVEASLPKPGGPSTES